MEYGVPVLFSAFVRGMIREQTDRLRKELPMTALALVDMAVRGFTLTPDHSGQRSRTAIGPCRVREWGVGYDDEGSEARSLGSVSVGAGAWWSVALSVPGASKAARDTVLVRIERHGPPADERHGQVGVDLILSPAEIDALVTLLGGVVAQARRDGVLPIAGS
jgi:hypothetical protein